MARWRLQGFGLTDVDVVRVPKSWSSDQVKAFALADNRTAELAEWNHVELSEQLSHLQVADWAVESLGFAGYEILNVRPDEVDDPFSLLSDEPRKDATQMTFTVSLGQGEIIKSVLAQANILAVCLMMGKTVIVTATLYSWSCRSGQHECERN